MKLKKLLYEAFIDAAGNLKDFDPDQDKYVKYTNEFPAKYGGKGFNKFLSLIKQESQNFKRFQKEFPSYLGMHKTLRSKYKNSKNLQDPEQDPYYLLSAKLEDGGTIAGMAQGHVVDGFDGHPLASYEVGDRNHLNGPDALDYYTGEGTDPEDMIHIEAMYLIAWVVLKHYNGIVHVSSADRPTTDEEIKEYARGYILQATKRGDLYLTTTDYYGSTKG